MAGLQKVLLVEDDQQIKEIYSSILEGDGYTLKTADTIKEMFDTLKSWHPDVILLDIMLPGGQTGLDGLKILRTEKKYGCLNTPVLMLTNLGDNDHIRDIWEKYANGYVVKAEIDPFEIPKIIQSLDSKKDRQSPPKA